MADTTDPGSAVLRKLRSLLGDYNNISAFQPGGAVDAADNLANANYDYGSAVNNQFSQGAQADSQGALDASRVNDSLNLAGLLNKDQYNQGVQHSINKYGDQGLIHSGIFLNDQANQAQDYVRNTDALQSNATRSIEDIFRAVASRKNDLEANRGAIEKSKADAYAAYQLQLANQQAQIEANNNLEQQRQAQQGTNAQEATLAAMTSQGSNNSFSPQPVPVSQPASSGGSNPLTQNPVTSPTQDAMSPGAAGPGQNTTFNPVAQTNGIQPPATRMPLDFQYDPNATGPVQDMTAPGQPNVQNAVSPAQPQNFQGLELMSPAQAQGDKIDPAILRRLQQVNAAQNTVGR